MYPIRFDPIYQDYIWGGNRIPIKYHRPSKKGPVAESWEISDREEGMSVVANGPFKGRTLHEIMGELGEKLMGEGRVWDRFPLLVKIIDAKENLSIQVHPDEKAAKILKGEPKAEMWVALEPGAIFAGLKKGVTEEEFRSGVKGDKVDQLLEKIDLIAGDVIDIPGGRVHAICAGAFLLEVQQNSNTTYRIYDWGRAPKEGKRRPLHLEEAISAIHWHDRSHPTIPHHHLQSDSHHQLITLLSGPFFVVERFDIFDQLHIGTIPKTFQIFFCMNGEGEICVNGHKEPLRAGMTYLIPAAAGGIEIEGRCELIRVRVP
ncbi:MAG: type I phosphomannose isomerase catalytic subunit [Chlamydiota bacterium]